MKHPERALTPAQLQAAWCQLHRPGRPATVEEALAHPLYSPLLRGTARAISREAQQRARPTFDARRAAANDFDD